MGPALPFDELLPDSRVEEIWEKLRREMKLDDEVEFATYVQPSRFVEKNGIAVQVPAHAVFIVTSPNPHPRLSKHTIRSHAAMKLEDWRLQEAQLWRFVGAPDQAETIFRALSHQHMEMRTNYRELN